MPAFIITYVRPIVEYNSVMYIYSPSTVRDTKVPQPHRLATLPSVGTVP